MIQLLSDELTPRPCAPMCPDCPMPRLGCLTSMVPPRASSCAFRALTVRARSPLPPRWFKEFGLAVVRRGILIRQRSDAHGRAIAIDVVGPGGLVPLGGASSDETNASGYAVNDVILCACPKEAALASLAGDPSVPRDLLALHAAALDRVERFVDARGRMTVIERVAAMVCAIADQLSPFRKTEVISGDLQQVDLAALVSSRQETVCRALSTLEKSGLIERTSDGLRISDRQRLEAV